MLACISCGKSKNTVNFSRHKKGSSGAGGNWALRAPISKKLQRPNLHIFRGKKYCTKCLRIAKEVSPVQYKTEVQTPIKSGQPAKSTLVQTV